LTASCIATFNIAKPRVPTVGLATKEPCATLFQYRIGSLVTKIVAQAALLSATPTQKSAATTARCNFLIGASLLADAIPEYKIYLAANPNAVGTLSHLGLCKIMTGAADEAIPLLEKAIRLGPRDPYFYLFSARIGFAHLFQGRIGEAIDWLEKSRRANPSFFFSRQLLASAYGLKGETDRAATELSEFLRMRPGSSTIARIRARWDTRVFGDRLETNFLAGLRKAGLPEE
jgi:tetratricopeptide (TPR) repeat protein